MNIIRLITLNIAKFSLSLQRLSGQNILKKEGASISLKSPISKSIYEAQRTVHIGGLLVCAYIRAFGDAYE